MQHPVVFEILQQCRLIARTSIRPLPMLSVRQAQAVWNEVASFLERDKLRAGELSIFIRSYRAVER